MPDETHCRRDGALGRRRGSKTSRVGKRGEGAHGNEGLEVVVTTLLVEERERKKKKRRTNYIRPEEEYTRRLLPLPIRIRPRVVTIVYWMQDKIVAPFLLTTIFRRLTGITSRPIFLALVPRVSLFLIVVVANLGSLGSTG